MADLIEVLGPSVLDTERKNVEVVKDLSRSLRVALGWHYLLDIPWLLRQFDIEPGSRFLDAGAGIGVIQWRLAAQGADVVSVDRSDRSRLPTRFRTRYRVHGLAEGDLSSIAASVVNDARRGVIFLDLARIGRDLVRHARGRKDGGSVAIHRAQLNALSQIPDGSIDHVVAVSSLEHNDPSALPAVVSELWRVLRPGGTFAATVGASGGEDWFHEPSKGWCYSEQSVRTYFRMPQDVSTNYGDFDRLLDETRANEELRINLPRAYSRSGNNGMPWGKWDPQYLSVGIRRDKPAP